MKIKVNDAMSAFASGLQSLKTETPVEDGGAGSGNWGHAGRPGKRGGSGKGGGSHYREGSKEGGYKAKMLTPGEAATKFGSRKGVTAGGGKSAAPAFAPKPKVAPAPSGKAANVSASSSKLNSLLGNGDSKAVAASLSEMCKTEPGKILINGKEAFMVGSDGKIHSSEGYDIDPNDAGDMQDVAEGSFIGKVEREASIDKALTASLVDATENGTAGQVLKAMPEGTEIMAGMFYCKKQNGSWVEVGHEGRTKLNDDQMASIVSKAAEGLNTGGGYGYGNSSSGGGNNGGQRIKPSEALEKAGYNAERSPLAVLRNGQGQQQQATAQPEAPKRQPRIVNGKEKPDNPVQQKAGDFVFQQTGIDLNKYRQHPAVATLENALGWDREGSKGIVFDWKDMSHNEQSTLQRLAQKYGGKFELHDAGSWAKTLVWTGDDDKSWPKFKTKQEEYQWKINRALQMGVPKEYAQHAWLADPTASKEALIRHGKSMQTSLNRRSGAKQAAKTREENKLNQALQRMGITREEYERRKAQEASGVDENGDPIPF